MTDFPELTSTGRWKSILYWPLAYFVVFYLFAAGISLSQKLGQWATLILVELLLFSTLFPFVLSFRYRSLRDIFLPRLLFIGASILYCMFAFRFMDLGAANPELSLGLFFLVWTAFIIPAASASDRVHRYSFYAILIAVAVVSFLPMSGQYNIYNFAMPVIFLAALWLLAALNSLFDAASVLFSYRLLRISAATQKFSKPFWRTALTTGASITLIYLASSVCFAALIAGFFWLLERSTFFPALTNLPRSTTFFAATHTAWIPTLQIASIPADIAHFLKAVKYMALSVCVPLLLTLLISVALIATKASGALIFPTALKLHRLLIDEKANERKFYTNYVRTSVIIGAIVSAVAYLAIKLYDA